MTFCDVVNFLYRPRGSFIHGSKYDFIRFFEELSYTVSTNSDKYGVGLRFDFVNHQINSLSLYYKYSKFTAR